MTVFDHDATNEALGRTHAKLLLIAAQDDDESIYRPIADPLCKTLERYGLLTLCLVHGHAPGHYVARWTLTDLAREYVNNLHEAEFAFLTGSLYAETMRATRARRPTLKCMRDDARYPVLNERGD